MASDQKNSCSGLFDCTLCGDCCKGFGGTYLTKADIDTISRYIGVTTKEFISEYTSPSGSKRLIAQGENRYCIFWDKVCTIHPVKPRMCRQWPFIPSILVDVGNWWAMAASCPGMNQDAPEKEIVDCVKKIMTP